MGRIVFANGKTFECPDTAKGPIFSRKADGREWKIITIKATYEEAIAAFVDNVQLFYDWESQGENGTETIRLDLTEYTVAGDVVDTRDGNISIFMGKPTELEKAELMLEAADSMAVVAAAVAKGEKPAAALAEEAAAYNAIKAKHGPPAAPDKPGKPGKPRP